MPLWSRVVIAVAAARVAVALALYLSGQVGPSSPLPLPVEVNVGLAATFGVLGVILVSANRDDVRAMWLGGIFVLVAAPLCSTFFAGRPVSDFGFLRYVRVDAFLPAFLWRFISEFPSPLTGRPGRVTRAVSHASAIVAFVVASINLSSLAWPTDNVPSDWRLSLMPIRTAGSFYYPLVFGLSAAALTMLLWRAGRAPKDARRRVLLFTSGLVGGSLPLAVQTMLAAIPPYYAFIHQRPSVEVLIGVFLFASLASVPFVTAYSVLFDRIVELRVVLRAALQYLLARYTIFVLTMVPFAALALVVLQHRSEPLAALLLGPRTILLGAMAAVGLVALRLRHRWLDALDRRFFREQYDARQILDGLVSDALAARDAGDLDSRIHDAIDRGLHARATLFVVNEPEGLLERPHGGHDPLSLTGILPSLVVADPVPMDLDPADPASLFTRLPADERRWVMDSDFRLLLALRGADGRLVGLLALSSKRSGLEFSKEDRRLFSAIGASVSLALDNLRLRAAPIPSPEPAARECRTCSRLNPPDASSCSCGGPVTEAAAPHILRGVFRLDRRIGAGGMGVVYHAVDLNLRRAVAIKTLPRMTPEDAGRLRREARAMATVTHANLAVIHGVETWRGIPFLVEEYLAGGTLADKLAVGRLAIGDALDIAATLAGALDYLHRGGLIHRDIKPSNIGFSAAGVTKLLDFGLARLSQSGDREHRTTTTLTGRIDSWAQWSSEGRLVGTPPYMSPEALRLEAPVPSFDVWALSVVLYESITGVRPFAGRDALQVLASVTTDGVTPPSALRDKCPPAIDAYFADAFHHEPSCRLPDAQSMNAALLRLRQVCG